nr:immunoglobulin light chain junction region [Macaca mulatta]
CQQHVDLPLTF